MKIISSIYNLFWGDLFYLPLPGGASIGISLLVLILIPVGIYFTIRTKFLPIRCFKDMLRVTLEKKSNKKENSISGFQALIVSTATRVGMGNMVGVVAAVSAAGAGAGLPVGPTDIRTMWLWHLGEGSECSCSQSAGVIVLSPPLPAREPWPRCLSGPSSYLGTGGEPGSECFLMGSVCSGTSQYKV